MTGLWTAPEAAAATGGTASGDWVATGVSIDSRTVAAGDLFVALSAARDGHDFVADALAKGAAAALVNHIPKGVAPERCLVVADVLEGLTALGVAARDRTAAKVIAVTGSVGKTTVKEMLRHVLRPQGRTHASEASYNNHWGVPLTLARMPRETEFAVIEIGMNAPGEIAPLSRMARPHVAIVTTIAAAHLEAFGRIEGIAEEKAGIFEGLEPGGVALINADIPTARILARKAREAGVELRRFGAKPRSRIRLIEARLTDETTVIRATMGRRKRLLKLPVPGRHFALNALAVLGAVDAVGADPVLAALALGTWQPVAGRGLRSRVVLRRTDDLAIELIDDAYNANPTSLAAGLEVLAAAVPARGGRRIAVLGDMLELGPDGPAMHAGIADLPSMEKIAQVHTCGPLMGHLHAVLPQHRQGQHADDAARLAADLPRSLRPGDVVFVKGSKGSKVSRVVDALRKLGQGVEDEGQGYR